jgi:hypothetical protein
VQFSSAADKAQANVLMTLAALSYQAENIVMGESASRHADRIRAAITQQLAQAGYATQGQWDVVWGPGLSSDHSNMFYVTKKKNADLYAVAIRGTDPIFIRDWVEDITVVGPVHFPFTRANDPNLKVAAGALVGLTTLIGLTDQTTYAGPNPAAGTKVEDFLRAMALKATAGIEIHVTGHSLGGCLASEMGVWLSFQAPQWQQVPGPVKIRTFTFAAPTAGNGNFANYCNQLLPDSYRVFNTLDVVPNAWVTLETIKTYYQTAPQCPVLLKAAIDTDNLIVKPMGYTQPLIPVDLPGAVSNRFSGDPLHAFGDELLAQHDSNNYLTLLGAAPIKPGFAVK